MATYFVMHQHLSAQQVQHHNITSALSRLLLSSLAFAVTKSMLSSLSSALALSTA